MTLGTPDNPYDLIVVGGGINGAGIARDAVLRGLSVALFEKNDFSTGATWASSGMIHGGIRYLNDDPTVTKKSCYDSGLIQKIAPHLLFRVPFLFPLRPDTAYNRVLLELAEVYFDTYDRYSPMKGGLRHSRLTTEEALTIEPGLPSDIIGAVTTDEWGIESSRLNYINAHDARERGATVHNYHEVTAFLWDDGSDQQRGAMRGVRVRDRLGGGSRDFYGRITFNATGAWAERFANRAGATQCRVRPGKGIHLVLAGRLSNYAIISEAVDGRQIFVAPHQNGSIIGTTDDDYWGDLDAVAVVQDEVEYLLDGVETIFPSIRQHRIVDTTVGCRPTLYQQGKYESSLSRDHAIFDHADEGIPNFMSIAGGKLAAYRLMAEEAVDAICEKLDIDTPGCSHRHALPGGEPHGLTPAHFEEVGLNQYAAQRILYRHGDRSREILEMLRSEPKSRALVDPSEPVTEAELRYVLRHEMVAVLDDARRRSRLGCGLDGGWDATFRAAEIFCEERGLGRGDRLDVAMNFQSARWRDRRAIVQREQLAAEEIGQTWFFGALGVHGAATDDLLGASTSDQRASSNSKAHAEGAL